MGPPAAIFLRSFKLSVCNEIQQLGDNLYIIGDEMFKLGVFTDEISQDLERALHVIKKEFQVSYVELRTMWNKNVVDLSNVEIRRAKKMLNKYSLLVSCIASPFLKCNLQEEKEETKEDAFFTGKGGYKEHFLMLKQSIELGKIFSTNLVRSFSFWRVDSFPSEETWQEIVSKIGLAVNIVKKEGFILALENEHGCNVATGVEAHKLIKEIDSLYLRLIWDPGNAYFAGEVPYPDGYNLIKDRIVHIHVKDATKNEKGRPIWLPVGKGKIDFRRQFRALKEDNFQGVVSLETHYIPEGGSAGEGIRESFAGMSSILQSLEIKVL